MTADPTRANDKVTFAVLATGVVAYALLQSLVTPVLPTIQAGLHTSQNAVTWVLTSYLVSASVFTPIMGRLGDMWGKERMMVVALLGLTVGCLLGALAGNLTIMIVARVIQGIGGGVLPLAFGIIRDEFPEAKVPGAVGLTAALAAAGAGFGLVLAGPIVDALDYHWLFWFPMFVLLAATLAAQFLIPESPVRTEGRLNWPATFLLSGWLVALLIGISEAPSWGWGSDRVIGLIVLAVILAVVWVVVENRSDMPLIDMRMMRIPAVWTTNLVALLFGVSMYAALGFLPEFLQTPSSAGYGFGSSITQSGFIMLPLSVAMFIFGSLSSRFAARFGAKNVLLGGSVITIATFVLLTVAHDHIWEVLLAMAIQGMGFGLAYAAMSSLVVQAVPAEQTGVASGMNTNIRTIGGAIGAAVMSSIVTSGVKTGSLPHESGYTHGFGLLALAAVGAAIAAIFVPTISKLRTTDAPEKSLPHPELGLLAGGTLVGYESE